jgi:Glycosyltransferase family 28 C-terminal domain
VVFASGPDCRQTVEQFGFRFIPSGLTLIEASQRARAQYPDWPWGPDFEHVYSLVHAGIAGPAMARDLHRVVSSFNPDVVVSEVSEFGGPLAAAAAGRRWAAVGWGLPVPAHVALAAGHAAASMWEQNGFDIPPYGGLYQHLYLDPCPPSLAPADGPPIEHRRLLRPVVPTSNDPVPGWLDVLPERPTVWVTLGTSGTFGSGASRLLTSVYDGLRDEEINVIITGTAAAVTDVGTMPPNVRTAGFIALANLLPRCDAVVSHAGSGTVLAALAHGLPQVLLPMGADQFRNAEAIANAGAGFELAPKDLTAQSLRKAVLDAVHDDALRAAAESFKSEIESMPDPASVVAALGHH